MGQGEGGERATWPEEGSGAWILAPIPRLVGPDPGRSDFAGADLSSP